MNRREFMVAGVGAAAALAVPAAVHAAIANAPSGLAVVDMRAAGAERFAGACAAKGLRVVALREDMADTWFADMLPVLRGGKVVGLTRPAEFEVFATLARDAGAQLQYRGLHRLHAAGASHQWLAGGDIERAAVHLQGADWSAGAAGLACDACACLPSQPCTPRTDVAGYQLTSWAFA